METARLNRRRFLAASSSLPFAPLLAEEVQKGPETRLVLLGTGGGPRPRKESSGSSQVIVANGAAYVIDCGDGVARQLVFADVPLPTLRHIFITHQHSDHTADYGNLIWLACTAGLKTKVDTWGPPPLERMTRLLSECAGAPPPALLASGLEDSPSARAEGSSSK
jgi:ribonuclease BN (tRNA processing enzyme)